MNKNSQFIVAILQTVAAVVWIVMAVVSRTAGIMPIIVAGVFVLLAISTWIRLFTGNN